MATVYDLIVIGSGPAGQRAAIYASKLGKKVALVEMREVVGGACINTGTIPSKTMREAVLHLSGYNYKSIYGMNYRVKERITMADLAFRVQHVIKTEIDVTEAQLSRNNIEMLVGVASFEDPTHVKVTNSKGSQIFEGKSILIATGTKPATSAKVPINGTTIVNSDLVLDLPNLPKTMIIVGGGVIGVEYCCMFAALGVRVTLIERRPRLLEFADQEIVEALSYHLRDARVTMRLNEEVESVEESEGSVTGVPGVKEESPGRYVVVRGRAAGQCGRVEPGECGDRVRLAGTYSGGQGLPDEGTDGVRGGRCDRVPIAGFGEHGAGAHCRGQGVWRYQHREQPQFLPIWDMDDPRD